MQRPCDPERPVSRTSTIPQPAGTDARGAFRLAVEAAGGAKRAAKAIGIARSYVDMLCTGKRKAPGLRVAFAIKRAFGIPASAWLRVKP